MLAVVSILLAVLLAAALSWNAMAGRRHFESRIQVLELLELASRRGLPLVPLLRQALVRQPRHFARALRRLADDLEQGEDLAEALEWAMPDSFPPSVRATIGAAEGTAELPEVLRSLLQQTDDRVALQHRTVMALLYPFTLGTFVIILVASIWGNATPGLMPAPAVWQGWITFGSAMQSSAVTVFLLAPSTLLGGLLLWRRSELLRRLGRDLCWRLPWRSGAAHLLASGQYLCTLSFLLRAGVVLPTAMIRAIGAAGSPRLEPRIRRAAESLEAGVPFDDALRLSGLPAFAVAGISAASKASPEQLADAMLRSAREARTRYLTAREQWLGVLGPVLLLAIGLAIGVCVFGAVLASVRVFQEQVLPW